MTFEEALCWCNQFEDNIILVNPRNPKKTLALQAMKQCKESLKKQIPKKPVVVGEEYIFEKDEWEKDYECPTCGNPYADDSYCSCCGQKLDWSDTE